MNQAENFMFLTLKLPGFMVPMLRRWTTPSIAAQHSLTDPGAPAFSINYRNPPGLWTSPRLTQLVEVQGARMIYLSGQAPADATYKVNNTNFRAQVEAVYDNIETALRSVGAGFQNIVKTTTYLTDAANLKELREVRIERYKNLKSPPANTLLIVSRLAEPEFLVEIDVVAAIPAR
jgi:2-iminobutanoate/2-iminopropanoate deaminase